jgi:uncharacterized protein YdeI (BOF family)
VRTAVIAVAAFAVLAAGVWYAFGGGDDAGAPEQGGLRRAQPAAAPVVPIASIVGAPETYVGKTVTVEGRITKECPSSGCWWYVKDASGEIRADSSGAGFALPLRQEGRVVRTTGKVVRTEGGDLQIAATSADTR